MQRWSTGGCGVQVVGNGSSWSNMSVTNDLGVSTDVSS